MNCALATYLEVLIMIKEKDKYRLLIENLPDGFAYHKMVLDSSGKPLDYVFLEVNSSFETLTGLSRENIIGKKVTEVYSGIKSLGFDWIDIYGKVAATGQSIHFQQYFELAEYWYEITAYSDQPGYFAVVFHDITKNKKAEEELRQREKNFFTLVENTPDMVVRFNLDLQHIYCNAAVEHQLGVPVHGFIGKTFLEIDGSPPEQLKSMHQLLQKALETGEEQQTEQSFPLPSGQKYFQTRIVSERDEKGRIESLLSVSRDITERKQAELLILVQRDLALAISFSHQLDKALSQCLDTMLQLSEMDCGGIYLIDQASGDLNLICHRNLSPAFIKSVSHYKADSTFARLVLQGKPLFTRYSDLFSPDEVNKAEKLLSFAILPLIFEQRVIGCINLASRKLEDVSQLNREMLKTAATLMGEGITRLKIEEELKETNQKLQKAIKNTIQAMALILEKRDPYTAGHQERVAELACAIAEEISLPKDKIEGLYMAGIIHDIGKINVPTEILSKPGRLSEIELSLIQTHPQVGSDILKEMELPGGVSAIVLQHHERMDGSGYPSGLSGDNILLEARILAVADVVEAMASHRPYRPALGIDKALEEISQNKDILYDPKVVDVCLRLFREKGFKFE